MSKFFNWKLWVGLLVSLLFMWLALRKVDIDRVWQDIQSAHILDLFLVVLLYLLQFFIRIWRWRILLEPLKKTGFVNRFHTVFIGFGANCVLPGHLGELVRANYLSRVERLSAGSVFGTIVVERLFDGIILLLIFFIGIITTPIPSTGPGVFQILRPAVFFFGGLIVFLLALIFFKSKSGTVLDFMEKCLFFLPNAWRAKIIQAGEKFFLGLVPLKNPYHWGQAIFYSCLLWFLALYQVDLIEHSLGLALSFKATFLIMTMATLGVLIPSSPGYIGPFHYFVQQGFILYGVNADTAFSAATLLHAAAFFPTLIIGLISFLYMQAVLSRKPVDASAVEQVTGETE
ncbi:MAG: UPF0104 family protein [Desulfobacteraceae bacterium]|nr:MAG: UPF0104 family protein [Desulfobacteraceae bacterium]